jgi:Flp pilus assembly protein TadD
VRFTLIIIATFAVALSAPRQASAQGNADPRLERAASFISGDRLGEAEQELNAILKARPTDALALNLLGTVRAKQGRLDEAEALFVRAVRLDDKFAGAHMNLAYLYLLRNAPEKTVAELRAVHRLAPEDADVTYKLAHLLLTLGRADECVAVVEDARRANRMTPPLTTLLGDAYLKNGDAGRAEESYKLALGADAGNADALLGLALVSQSKGDAPSASAYLARVKPLVADLPEMLYRFAVAAMRSEMYDDAKGALERAAQLRPDEPAYLVALGAVWLKKPDLFEAERVFRQALKLQPDNPQAQMYLGYTLLKQKKLPEARELLESSAKRDASAPETFYYLGLIAEEQNEDARAVELFGKSVSLAPSLAVAHIALGSTYLKLRDYERARQELEKGVKLKPDDSKAHYNLARLYALLKEPGRAKEEMAIVEKLKNAGQAQTQEADTPAPSSPR